MKIKDLHPLDRPREKLIRLSPKRLKNNELLAILINVGTQGKNAIEIADQILKKYSLNEFYNLDYVNLVKLLGINQAKACQFLAIKELVSRKKEKVKTTIQIEESKTAAIYFEDLRQLKKERLVVLYLNIHNQVIWKETITIGTVDGTTIHPREVF